MRRLGVAEAEHASRGADRAEQGRGARLPNSTRVNPSCSKGSRRAHADAPARGHRKSGFPAGTSIAITTGWASERCGCRRASIVSTDDDIGKSVYPDIIVHQREIPEQPARDRSQEGDAIISRATRSAQAARADRSASLVRLQGRGVADAGERRRRGAGSLCGRTARRRPFRWSSQWYWQGGCWPADGDIVA